MAITRTGAGRGRRIRLGLVYAAAWSVTSSVLPATTAPSTKRTTGVGALAFATQDATTGPRLAAARSTVATTATALRVAPDGWACRNGVGHVGGFGFGDPISADWAGASGAHTSSSSSSSSSSSPHDPPRSRSDRIRDEMERMRHVGVGDLKRALQKRGVRTASLYNKSEFLMALAVAKVDGVGKRTAVKKKPAEEAWMGVGMDMGMDMGGEAVPTTRAAGPPSSPESPPPPPPPPSAKKQTRNQRQRQKRQQQRRRQRREAQQNQDNADEEPHDPTYRDVTCARCKLQPRFINGIVIDVHLGH